MNPQERRQKWHLYAKKMYQCCSPTSCSCRSHVDHALGVGGALAMPPPLLPSLPAPLAGPHTHQVTPVLRLLPCCSHSLWNTPLTFTGLFLAQASAPKSASQAGFPQPHYSLSPPLVNFPLSVFPKTQFLCLDTYLSPSRGQGLYFPGIQSTSTKLNAYLIDAR